MAKKYIIKLTTEEREELQGMLRRGKHAAKKLRKARLLLKADDGCKDTEIYSELNLSVRQIENMRKYFVEEGFENFLQGRYCNRQYFRKLDGKQEAQLVTIACSSPPEGRKRWTLHLLADRMVELHFVDCISHEAVRQVLKKTKLSPG
jgi:transposase